MDKYLFILENNPLFRGISQAEIREIIRCLDGRLIKRAKDTHILRAGDRTDSLGILLKGSFLVTQVDLWGHRSIIRKTFPGDIYAIPFAAKQGSTINVNLVAVEDCEILELNLQKVLTPCSEVCPYHHRLIGNLASVLAEKVFTLNDKITHMSKRTTREKLLSYLSSESRRQGKLSFDIPFDRQQLADFLCVERAAMSTELSKLQKDGYLKTNRNHFELFERI